MKNYCRINALKKNTYKFITMECSVCYENTSTCKLVCGHSFCMSCIKEWYLKSEEDPTCPMCRQRLYFKGMHKQEQQWENERYENENGC